MSKKKDKNRFYVYALLDPRKPGKYEYKDICFLYEPFYIGKGSGNRCFGHFKKSSLTSNSYKNNKIKKIVSEKMEAIVLKIKEYLIENKAFTIEKKLISIIGRHDIKQGPLTNLDNGGKSGSGNILSEETKLKIGKNNARYWKNKKMPKEAIERGQKARKPQSFLWRCRTFKIISPEGKEYIVKDGLNNFAKKHNLSSGHLNSIATKKRNHHKGWKCEYIGNPPKMPRDYTYKLISPNGEEIITNKITKFAKLNNLDYTRLYEVARGEHCIHRGWKCEYYNPN